MVPPGGEVGKGMMRGSREERLSGKADRGSEWQPDMKRGVHGVGVLRPGQVGIAGLR